MVPRRLWHVRNKWRRHLSLIGSRRVLRHIPPTRLLTRESLRSYLGRYKEVYIKPIHGSYGNNIMKVSRRRRGYIVQREQHIRRVGRNGVVQAVFRHARSRSFMIQRGVSILTNGRRPVDFRILLLRPNDRWELMGIMGKVATGNRIVTNYRHGGKPIQLRTALQRAGWSNAEIARCKASMERLCRAAAEQFTKRHRQCRRLGVDIAVDRRHGMWILEVNTNPEYALFRYHENKQLHARIGRIMRVIRSKQSRR
jgi:glutathione synthase/RimK-type ligase-like ATP-grasp enzyme